MYSQKPAKQSSMQRYQRSIQNHERDGVRLPEPVRAGRDSTSSVYNAARSNPLVRLRVLRCTAGQVHRASVTMPLEGMPSCRAIGGWRAVERVEYFGAFLSSDGFLGEDRWDTTAASSGWRVPALATGAEMATWPQPLPRTNMPTCRTSQGEFCKGRCWW